MVIQKGRSFFSCSFIFVIRESPESLGDGRFNMIDLDLWKNKPLRRNPKADRLIQAFENNSLNNYFGNNDTLRGCNTQMRVAYVSQMYNKSVWVIRAL